MSGKIVHLNFLLFVVLKKSPFHFCSTDHVKVFRCCCVDAVTDKMLGGIVGGCTAPEGTALLLSLQLLLGCFRVKW